MKRLLSLGIQCFSVLLAVIMCGVPAYAAPSLSYIISNTGLHNEAVDTLAGTLERRYGISISYPFSGDGIIRTAAIYPETLQTLDKALEAITPQVVRQISDYYRERNGKPLTFRYVIRDMRNAPGGASADEVQVAGFNPADSCISLYIPGGNEPALATGDNPMVIAHELGHAVQLMITDRYGFNRMEREWSEFLDGESYGNGGQNDRMFVTEYSATDFEEDFAETFAHIFICDRPGLGFSYKLKSGGQLTPLGRKVDYIERLLPMYFTESAAMMGNFRKVYTTPSSLSYNGLKLSGFYLVFSGLPEPQNVPSMLLTRLMVEEKNTVWIPEIGGWYCVSLFGKHLVLFPEGTFGNPGRSLLIPQ